MATGVPCWHSRRSGTTRNMSKQSETHAPSTHASSHWRRRMSDPLDGAQAFWRRCPSRLCCGTCSARRIPSKSSSSAKACRSSCMPVMARMHTTPQRPMQ
eukprot:474619-Prorocentrum_minimum.AAC.1